MSTEYYPAVGDDEQADARTAEPIIDGSPEQRVNELITVVAQRNIAMIMHGRTGDHYQYMQLIDPRTLTVGEELRQPVDELNRAMLDQVYAAVLPAESAEPRILNKESVDIAEYNVFRTDQHGDQICEQLLKIENECTFRVSVVFPMWSWRRGETEMY